jgi:transposase
VIAMEACATAHHWARAFHAAGHEVRPINPRFGKPCVRVSKNGAVDAGSPHNICYRVQALSAAYDKILRQCIFQDCM